MGLDEIGCRMRALAGAQVDLGIETVENFVARKLLMTIRTGNRLPDANLFRLGDSGPEKVRLGELTKGRKVAIFGVPGAFTPTCSDQHVPSFVENRAKLNAKGIEEIICISVNDPFVMKAWGESTGATEAGILMLADANAEFTKSMGLSFTIADAGLIDRASRFSMVVDDGLVVVLNVEDAPGTCDATRGESILGQF